MNVASGYSIASNYSSYGTEKISPTSSTKPFTMPPFIEAPMIGQLTFVGERNYNPFKDIAETGSVNFPEFMQTKATPTRSDEEILRELEELAKEHARTGQYYDKHDDERYLKLIGSSSEKTRLKVSWEGMPSGSPRMPRSQGSLDLPKVSMSFQVSAPQMTEAMAMKRMSPSKWALVRSTLLFCKRHYS